MGIDLVSSVFEPEINCRLNVAGPATSGPLLPPMSVAYWNDRTQVLEGAQLISIPPAGWEFAP